MGKLEEQYKWRREGMLYAHKRASETSLEELKKEIIKRGLLKLDITISEDDIKNSFSCIHENIASTVIPLMLTMLEEDFNFSEEDLKKAYKGYEKRWLSVMDLDYIGEHYVTFADYCIELNDRYNFNFNIENANKCLKNGDSHDKEYHSVNVESLINSLELDGYPAAALYLKKKIS